MLHICTAHSHSYIFCFYLLHTHTHTHAHFSLCWVMRTRSREMGLISVWRFLFSGSHSDPHIHRSQWPSCRDEASEATHRQGRALLWTCSSPIEETWEPHINHVLMYNSLISQAVTCCQQVLLTQLFRALMRSKEQRVRKWAKGHSVVLICLVVLHVFPPTKLE